MSTLIHAELLKIRTTRSWWAYLIVIVLLTGVGAAGQIGSAGDRERSTLQFQLDLADTVGLIVLLAIILGISVITTEFRHGTITPTFLAAPRRERVLAAKTVSVAIVALGFALLSLLVLIAVAVPWLAIVDATTHFGDGEVWEQLAQAIFSAVLWGLLGVAIGTLVQNQVAALVGTLVWLFVVETLVTVLLEWLPLDGVVSYTALPRARRRRRDGRRQPAVVRAGRRRLARLDRAARRRRSHPHPAPRHHLTRTLAGWPRRYARTRRSSSRSTRSPTAGTASRA